MALVAAETAGENDVRRRQRRNQWEIQQRRRYCGTGQIRKSSQIYLT